MSDGVHSLDCSGGLAETPSDLGLLQSCLGQQDFGEQRFDQVQALRVASRDLTSSAPLPAAPPAPQRIYLLDIFDWKLRFNSHVNQWAGIHVVSMRSSTSILGLAVLLHCHTGYIVSRS